MNKEKNILVCVTQQKTCERLIKKASEMLNKNSVEIFVIHVAKNNWNFLDNVKEGDALEYLFEISKSIGANLTVLRSDKIVETISDFAKENSIGYIILGQSPEIHSENNFHNELRSILPNIEFCIVPQIDN